MKKMKKTICLIIMAVMVLSMALCAQAAEPNAVPSEGDSNPVAVYNVEEGVTVTAYQIVDATYGTHGLTGYIVADGVSLSDIERPTAAEITAITRNINNKVLTTLESETLSWDSTTAAYTADLGAGTWLILVSNCNATVYNPMIVSNWYENANEAQTLTSGYVDADGNYEELSASGGAVIIYAKKDTTIIDKEITNYHTGDGLTDFSEGADYNVGDSVSFHISTYIPDYSDSYANGKTVFTITDTMSDGLAEVSADAVTVYVGDTVYSPTTTTTSGSVSRTVTNYTLTVSGQVITIAFEPWFIIEHGAESVDVYYTTILEEDAFFADESNPNSVLLEYSNHPDTTYFAEDIVYVYTFRLTDEIAKVTPDGTASSNGSDVTVTNPLAGAEFTIYTDADCTQVYSNSLTDGVMTTGEDGYVTFEGLAEGTYYIRETESPDNYMLNDTIYMVVISAVYDTVSGSATEGMLLEYTITSTDLTTGTEYSNTYEIDYETTEIDKTDERDAYILVSGYTLNVSQNPVAIVDPDLVRLPSTGGAGVYVIIGISMAILGACGVFVIRKRKISER